MRLGGKVAIVTGAASGIGEGIARRLAAEGANLVLLDILTEPLTEVAEDIRTLGVKALAAKTDVTRVGEVNKAVRDALTEFGKIDILVNNVGGSAKGKAGPFCKSTEEVWRSVIERNLFSTLICCRAVIGHMMERQSGKIVNMASGAAAGSGTWDLEYAAAKAAIIAATKVLAREVANYGINVNVISPGAIDTMGLRSAVLHGEPAYERLIKLEKSGALRVVGKAEDVGNLVAFLVSDEASLISGRYFEMGCLGRADSVAPSPAK